MKFTFAFLLLLAFMPFAADAASDTAPDTAPDTGTPAPLSDDFLLWDIADIFDGPQDEPAYQVIEDPGVSQVLSLIRRRGIIFDASYEFWGGFAPGWSEAPWFTSYDRDFSWAPAVRMRADFGIDAQISEVFRVRTSVYFTVPDFSFTLGEFFFDYNLHDRVFFRAGKFGLSWGISPNFSFTDLPARVPGEGPFGDAFIARADVPVGIGGLQLLALTRADLMRGNTPRPQDIGWGGKYNLAFRWADFDMGVFFQQGMASRGFLSVNTTIGNTEVYKEGMLAIDHDGENGFFNGALSGAFNVGFARDFFSNRLTVNGELFYNAEDNAFWVRPGTTIRDTEVSPFIQGFNMAVNLLYRLPGFAGNPRFFLQALYAPAQNTAQLVPGFRINILPHTELYVALPMALGSRDGFYYRNPIDIEDRRRPFSLVMLITLRGSVRAAHHF